jgi:hypothetical protein
VEAVEKHVGLRLLDRHHHPLSQLPQVHCLGCHMAGDEVPLGRLLSALLRYLVQRAAA